VLHFSRAERQMIRVRKETLAMAPLVREITERFVPLAGNAALRIRSQLDERLVAPVDPECLHQILINLLDNAVKYGGGTVIVRTLLREAHARIEVEDAGTGIPAADRERVWSPFVRLRRSDGVPGSGIGLAVVRQLVAAHGGRTGIEDVPGGGSRFVVELPGAIVADLAMPGDAGRVVEASWPEC
jgi:signal transduction histidine kinase